MAADLSHEPGADATGYRSHSRTTKPQTEAPDPPKRYRATEKLRLGHHGPNPSQLDFFCYNGYVRPALTHSGCREIRLFLGVPYVTTHTKRWLSCLLSSLACITIFQAGPLLPPLHAEDAAGKWTTLFDGSSLEGWVQKNGTATYKVVDGTIEGTTKEGSLNSFLCSKKEYGDFELEFDVRVSDHLNSGVQIRSKTREKSIGKGPNNAAGRVMGPQVEIEASGQGGAEAGYIYGEATGLGWLTPKDELIPHKNFKDGQWNHFRVMAKGPKIQTWINGKPIANLDDANAHKLFPRGFIGLQVHRIKPGTGPYKVAWRNIRIREL